MDNRLAVDLKVFRRRSGLDQADVARLLDVHRSQLSKFEGGTRQPSMEQVTLLCLIYGMHVPEFCVAALPQFEQVLAERLVELLREPVSGSAARTRTLDALRQRLPASDHGHE